VHITDAMNRFGGMGDNLRPAAPGMRLFGPAVTVRTAPGDNLMVYKAFEVAQPGDVLVIEARGFTTVAQWGDITSYRRCRCPIWACLRRDTDSQAW
jgi:4-hydroxy-4-methyl-2-oxoglutarate aldolase